MQFKPAFTKKSLSEKIELLVRKDKLTYAEAIIYVCEENDIDPHDISVLIPKGSPLFQKLEAEAIKLNRIKSDKNTATLQ